MKKTIIILFIYLIAISCQNKDHKKDSTLEGIILAYLYLNHLYGNIQFERKDYSSINNNVNKFYGLNNITYGDGSADGYTDNFLTPTGMYFTIAGIAAWKSPENGGIPYGQENWWNANIKVLFANDDLIGRLINLKSDFDRYFLSYEFKGISSEYDRIGFILTSIEYLFSPNNMAEPRFRVLDIGLKPNPYYFPYPIFKYLPEEIESKLDDHAINDLTFYDFFIENVGLIQAITNISLSPKCNSMIEKGYLEEFYNYGLNGFYSCLVNEENNPYASSSPMNTSPLRLNLSIPFLKEECIAGTAIPIGICSHFDIIHKGESTQYVKATNIIETISGNSNPNIREYIKNKNGLIVLPISEEFRKKLDNPDKIITFQVDAANIFFWDSDSLKTVFDPSIDRPNPSIGKDLKIYLPKISVRVE